MAKKPQQTVKRWIKCACGKDVPAKYESAANGGAFYHIDGSGKLQECIILPKQNCIHAWLNGVCIQEGCGITLEQYYRYTNARIGVPKSIIDRHRDCPR